jgi:hypothetical protein
MSVSFRYFVEVPAMSFAGGKFFNSIAALLLGAVVST